MSKRLVLQERPEFTGVGNYKGVMLCNRPTDAKPMPKGPLPFLSRVDPKLPLGWNPVQPEKPVQRKPKKITSAALLRHKRYLQELAFKKEQEKNKDMEQQILQEEKKLKMKQNLEKKKKQQHQLVENYFKSQEEVKSNEDQKVQEQNLQYQESEKLAADSSFKNESTQKQSKAKPKWALTEDQLEEREDVECQNLLNFVQELDYESYIQDFEVKQALELLKNRIEEIKKDEDWKVKIAQQYNGEANQEEQQRQQKNEDFKEKEENWDTTTKAGDEKELTEEEKIARQLANTIMQGDNRFKHIHSKRSIRKMLEREAQRQLYPQISIIKDKELRKNQQDMSNLPYLHRNPAV